MTNQPELNYETQIKTEFWEVIDALELEPLQKAYLKSRWLEQVMWLESRASSMRDWHRRLRIGAILAGAIVPILITMNFDENKTVDKWLKVVTVGISAAVTVAGAVEEFSQFGEKWFRYRRAAEVLKSQGWQFMQRSGAYREFTNHRLAFPMFAEQVEGIIQRDVEVYVEESLQSRRGEKPLPGMSDGGRSS
jgi:hypothetical protein